jgi:monofunctional biosynthetic peptidoglycan transglycosylase
MAKKGKSSAGRRFLARVVKYLIYLLGLSLLYLLVCKWVMPPVTVTQLSSLFRGDGLKRDYVSWSEMAPSIKLAVIASEDQLFPDHGGFDWKALEKSVKGEGKGKKKRPRGAAASTITQQTAKNVFLWQGNGWSRYVRKLPEAFYTKMIEWVWGKERILEVYLNVIETGPGIFGVEAAAQHYFGKPASRLSRAEAAMIAAALPNPRRFTVKPMSRRVQWRYPQILRQMNNLESDPDVRALIR